jgi:hypothetical protein
VTECIPCLIGETDKDGYRRLSVQGTGVRAHRYVWIMMRGPIPPGLVVRHKCDNPPCINIDHLELGTVKQNAQDMMERGRFVPKPINLTKLSELQAFEVVLLLKDGAKPLDIAEHLGVRLNVVKDIKRGRTWKNIPR